MRIILRHSVSTDQRFPPESTFVRLSAFLDAHLVPPFALDRPQISALIDRFCISALIPRP
jgi:hypothetical protein